MSNWDLMMPGMGLTAIGLAGVVTSYSGIAHTFIDGMHALTGLTMFIGLIFLSAGILEGGVSTSNRAKATTLVILSIVLSFAVYGFTMNTISTTGIFAGVLLIIAIPAIVMAYVAMKIPTYAKPVGTIFALAGGTAVVTFVAFGFVGPDAYLVNEPVEEVEEVPETLPTDAPVFAISILVGSAEQGNPDYEPDVANVPKGNVIEWINLDEVAHTVTSSLDFGETFDSGLMNNGETFILDTSDLELGEYEYFCIVHPWMIATIVVQEPVEPIVVEVAIPEGAGIQQIGQLYYDPEVVQVELGTTVLWNNVDTTIHTVTSGTPENGPSELFDSGLVGVGETFEYTFTEAETVDYYCIVHPWMVGTVEVS